MREAMKISLDTDDMERTPPQTESAKERGFKSDAKDADYGRSDAEEESGDIADEGPGHRG
jgi:hypothetical protein